MNLLDCTELLDIPDSPEQPRRNRSNVVSDDSDSDIDGITLPPHRNNPVAASPPQRQVPIRRSSRSTAGRHPNPHNLPHSVLNAEMISQVVGEMSRSVITELMTKVALE